MSIAVKTNGCFLLDLKDDFEEIGRGEKNFTIDDFLQDDLSRAVGFGRCYKQWNKEQMWFPVSIRKIIRHLPEIVEKYEAQLNWIIDKHDLKNKEVVIDEYCSLILNELFCDDRNDLLKLAIVLGASFTNEN